MILSLQQYDRINTKTNYFEAIRNYQQVTQSFENQGPDTTTPQEGITFITQEPNTTVEIKFNVSQCWNLDNTSMTRFWEYLAFKIVPTAVLSNLLKDIQLLIQMTDYFQLNIWDDLFEYFLSYRTFQTKNAFLKLLANTLQQGHPQLAQAVRFTKKQLSIPDSKTILLNPESVHQLTKYCRSVYRSIERELRRYTYSCVYCARHIRTYSQSRPVRNYGINHGFRLHCCGLPTCNNCFSHVSTLAFCDLCNTHFSGSSQIDTDADIAFAAMDRNNFRLAQNIPITLQLPTHPATIQNRPQFIQ